MKAKKIDTTLIKDDNLTKKILFIIFIFTLLLYSNSIKNKYAFDDNYVTVINPDHPNNPRIEKGIKGIPQIFKTHYVESASQSFEYRPLPLATFAVEYQFFGSNPHVSHFISVLLYAITCMLLFVILTKLFKNYHLIFPVLITILFIVHPIHSEVVDNIKCRDELMSFLFGLCALHFFIKSIEIENKKWPFISLTILFLFMGLLCKITAVLFIVFIPITAYFFYDFKLKKIIGLVFIFFIGFIIYGLFKRSMIHNIPTVRKFVFFENPLYFDHGFLTHISVALYSMGYYLKMLIFPYPLCCYYGYNTIPIADWTSPFIYLALIFYVCMGVYALIKLPQKNIFSFAVIAFILGVLPFSNLLMPVVGIVGERFVYFASFGFCIIMAYMLLLLFKIDVTDKSKFKIQNTTPSFKVVLVGILFMYSCLVISRNTAWKDILTLLKTDVQTHQNSCNLNYLIGSTLSPEIFNTPDGLKRQAMIKEATLHYKEAAQLMEEGIKEYPQDFTTLNNIGTIYMNIYNNPNAAFPFFKKAVLLNPKDVLTQYNFAFCYEKKNRPDSAIYFYEKLVKSNTTYLQVFLQLRELYIAKKAYLKAVNVDEKAINLNPMAASLRVNLGNSFLLTKDTLSAINQFKKAIELEPKNYSLRTQIETFIASIKK